MISKVDKRYFATWREVCRSRGWKPNDDSIRYAMHAAAGVPQSHTVFRAQHWDRVFPYMKRLLDPYDLDAVMDLQSYINHDAAQAAHVPIVKPGKPKRKADPPRTWPSKYEEMTEVDDPGERKRRVYVISRLFEPRLIDTVCRDRFLRSDWQDLPLPQLTDLRDLLKSRLSKFITKVKAGKIEHDFGFSLFDFRAGRPLPNVEIISILLQRGKPVRMHEQPAEPQPMECPF